MASVTRELVINYGGFIVGGAAAPGSERLIDGALRIDRSFTGLTVSFDFVISQATEANFAAEVAICEVAFRDPFRDLTISQGAATLIDCRPSANTGLNTQPSITKSDHQADTGRSRRYSVTIDAELPADNSPTVGIRESTINVAFSPARKRTVTISGVVTAEGGSEARAKYTAIIAAYTTAILTALGGTYELGEEPTTETDFQDKLISFSRVFDEIIFSQAGSADDARIIRQQLTITRNQVAPGDTTGSNAVRLIELSATYAAWIDKDETQDLSGVWDSIKVWVYAQIADVFGAGAIAVTSVAPQYAFDENRISATISAVGASSTGLLEHRETVQIEDVVGNVLVPVWSGNALGKYLYQGPSTTKKTTTIIEKEVAGSVPTAADAGRAGNRLTSRLSGRVGGAPSARRQRVLDRLAARNQPANSGPESSGGGGQPEYILMSTNTSTTPLTLGTDNQTIDIVERTTVTVEEGYVQVIAATPAPSEQTETG